jgi:bifunctional non-homologous end joining protein LigD
MSGRPPNPYALGPRMAHPGRRAGWAASQLPVTFVAFDLLHLEGQDRGGRPLVERKGLLDGRPGRAGLVTNGWYCDGDSLLAVSAEHGHEGLAKRLDSPYLPGQADPDLAEKKIPGAWTPVQRPRRQPRVPV